MRRWIVFVFAFFLCAVALAQSVRTTYRPGIDFAKYHTYKWVEVKGGQHPDPSLDAQIKQVIDSQLTSRGLMKVDDAPDLNVDYQVALSKAEVWQTYEDWSDMGPAARLPQRRKVTLDIGTLALDMYDTSARELVWTGRANGTIDPNSSEVDKTKKLENASQKLLKDFPPKHE
jgi:hypothetical protein